MKRKLLRIPDSLFLKLKTIQEWTELDSMQSVIIDCMNRGAKWFIKQMEAEKKAAASIPNATDQDHNNHKPNPEEMQYPDLDEETKRAIEIAKLTGYYDQ